MPRLPRASLREDPEHRPPPPTVEEQLAGTMFAPWPESPPVTPAEQRPLLLEAQGKEDREPVAVRYARWRETAEGRRLYAEVRRRAALQATGGAKVVRVKAIAEDLRAEKITINNSFLAPMSRELYDKEPILRGLLELRQSAA